MNYIDTKYVDLISHTLLKFKKINNNTATFRCPFCGDSKKNKNKTRGYLYSVKNSANFKCHNCSESMSLRTFLKALDPSLYKEYSLEVFRSNNQIKETYKPKNNAEDEELFKKPEPIFNKKIDLPKATTNAIASAYLDSRKLPKENFYYAEKFKEWCNTMKVTFYGDSLKYEESRIVIPIHNKQNNLIGFQGRTLDSGKNPAKYITIIMEENSPKIYGLNTIDESEAVYIVEGVFDSLFIPNSIAMCGSDIPEQYIDFENKVYIFDNEPRNIEICNKMNKLIDAKNSIVIWPPNVTQNDINDMILAGINLMDVIESNTVSGLSAKIKFNDWKKV
jgi:transcription elongation factor Elf1